MAKRFCPGPSRRREFLPAGTLAIGGACMMKNDEAQRRAYRRAGAQLGFYIHLAAYLVVNPLLVFINYSTSPRYLWFLWPLFGWGIGLLCHWLAVFVGPRLMQHLVQSELKKDGAGD
jgi:hypothetical protein